MESKTEEPMGENRKPYPKKSGRCRQTNFAAFALAIFLLATGLASCLREITVTGLRIQPELAVITTGQEVALTAVVDVQSGKNSLQAIFKDSQISLVYSGSDISKRAEKDILAKLSAWRVEYVSGDESVFEVAPNGTIKALAPGQAELKAIAVALEENPSQSRETEMAWQATLSVVQQVEGIQAPGTLSLTEGDSVQLNAKASPSNASDPRLAYATADESIAVVDENGRVRALKAGETQLFVTSLDVYASTPTSASVQVKVNKKPEPKADPQPATTTPAKTSDPPKAQDPTPVTTPTPVPVKDQPKDNNDVTLELLGYVNEARIAAGKPALTYSDELGAAAAIRAPEINILFSHTRPDGSAWHTVSPLVYGENIAAGPSSAKAVFDMWMGSPGHKANILSSDFKTMGACRLNISGSEYGYYWVQLFGH